MTTHFSIHPTLCHFFKKELKFSLCCPPVLGCVAFAWSLGDLPRQHSWRKSTLHLLTTVICQWLFPWARTLCLPRRSVLGGCLTSTCTALVRPSTNTVISYVQLPCCVWETVSLWLSTVAGSYILCSLSSIITPEPWKRGGYVIDVPFRAENSAVPCCLHLYQSWVSVLITVCWK